MWLLGTYPRVARKNLLVFGDYESLFLVYTLVMRLRALFLMLLLLLPSGLGAAVSTAQNCMTMQANLAMDCCCSHEDPSSEPLPGPGLERTCCCEAKAPLAPLRERPAPRSCDDPAPKVAFAPLTSMACLPQAPEAGHGIKAIEPGPPRAPPWPPLLRSQRFLI